MDIHVPSVRPLWRMHQFNLLYIHLCLKYTPFQYQGIHFTYNIYVLFTLRVPDTLFSKSEINDLRIE